MFVVRDSVREPLYAVVPYHNPWRHKAREKHTERAIKHFMDAGCVVVLVEVAFNRRDFVWADSGIDRLPATKMGPLGTDHKFRSMYIPLRSDSEIWLKENSINVAAQRLPWDWENICWLDSDVHFIRPNWVGECIHKLQHYSFIQMFSQAFDISPTYEELPAGYPHSSGVSFMQAYSNGTLNLRGGNILHDVRKVDKSLQNLVKDVKQPDALPYPGHVWPGLAWAATRKAWDGVGGLFDSAVWGGGDYDMAHAMLEQVNEKIHPDMHEGYLRLLLEWENRCKRHIRKNVGVMAGAIYHYWHGRKADRHYESKRKLMRMVQFDPIHFLKRDYQGLWQFHDDGSDNFVQFRDTMRKIALARDEDNNDTRLDLMHT